MVHIQQGISDGTQIHLNFIQHGEGVRQQAHATREKEWTLKQNTGNHWIRSSSRRSATWWETGDL